jgi:hypothetical protein
VEVYDLTYGRRLGSVDMETTTRSALLLGEGTVGVRGRVMEERAVAW